MIVCGCKLQTVEFDDGDGDGDGEHFPVAVAVVVVMVDVGRCCSGSAAVFPAFQLHPEDKM